MKKHVLLFLFAVLSFSSLLAHNSLSALYYLELKDNLGILSISVSQDGLNEALKKQYLAENFTAITTEKYKELAVRYIKDHFDLMLNNEVFLLNDGGIKLGSHQTDFKFLTDNLPRDIRTITISIDAFRENKEHQTIFSVALGTLKDKVILNVDNDYKATLHVENNILVQETHNGTKHLGLLLAILVLLSVAYFYWSKKKKI
ncbi:hypothetical protein I2486_19515 [Cellulophaga sp. E16_2]|uniref:LPXTG-motif cell wall anchor domain protein n=1 Tax=Cellulophaga algicola (strain DSM 14237 / IC166 / ACAM 630) TaxID=688270 RepID=E6XD19_CELAD|nr:MULTISPECIES: hypothetical protein [Cellulophaga]ADV51206.1 hypothetical protein Celal_3962 [Cellulophaga algicola DSM 14237]MBO0593593.1 hypothetical protein [Cellulophaga sp. E16_2]